ncbi:MAG: response regulator [Leptolyngbyaceae cyanobacterium bins.59]|nr:response regulator [Leptolyngbyaceae cyanobacterium bins.59]
MSSVLVVDDSQTLRFMMTELLRANAFKVTAVRDGEEALQQIEEDCPDVVVLDIVMPRLNGYEVCRRLKSNPATQNVSVILCSSNATDVDRYWGLKQGADAYLCKPFRPEELIDTVKQVLQGTISHR